jgi:sec-independent protein translocase protein TatA
MSLGIPELVVLVVIVLLFFGPSRLPGLGKAVGSAIRGFKKGISTDEDQKKITEKKDSDENDKV